MAESPKKAQSKIRTFAQDLSMQREKRGVPETTPQVKATKEAAPVITPLAKAPSETKEEKQPNRQPEKRIVVPPPTKAETEPEVASRVTPAPVAKKIPAFHELQEEVASIQKNNPIIAEPAPVAHQATEQKIEPKQPRMNIGYDAEIITDTKHKRFKLFPAIGSSLKGWWAVLTKPRKKVTPTYSVTETSRRKGVIQKATSKSGSVFTSSNADIKEKIRQRKQREEEEEKKKIAEAAQVAEHEPETIWSPFTEPGFDLLNRATPVPVERAPKNVTVEFKKQQTLAIVPEKPMAEPVIVPTEPDPLVDEVKEDTRWTEPQEPQEPQERIIPVKETASMEMNEIDFFTDEELLPEQDETEFLDAIPEPDRTGINRFDTNTLAILLVGFIMVVAVLIFSVQFLIEMFSPTEDAPIPAETAIAIVGAETDNITLQDNQSIVSLLRQKQPLNEDGMSDSQIYSQNGDKVPPAVVIELLQFDIEPSFRQALTDVRFIHHKQSKPIILFSFTDDATVRGGFLAWEESIAADFRTLYDIPTNQTVNFTDQRVSDTDVRVLLLETGQTLLVYGIINENTALISNNLENFSHVLETSFSN